MCHSVNQMTRKACYYMVAGVMSASKLLFLIKNLSLTWVCRKDEVFVVKHTLRKAFHVGSNSSCRQHIRSHYELYKACCAEQNIPEHHHAVPHELERVRKKHASKEAGQKNLTNMFGVASHIKSKEFAREEVLRCVAEFMVCDNQGGAPSIWA